MTATETIRARIDSDVKARASAALEAMGLSMSDVIRKTMRRIADERRLPFEVYAPNAETATAIEELERGKGKRFKTAEALFDDLGI